MSAKPIEYLMQQFWQFQGAGKLPEARFALKKILKAAPLHAEALYLLGMTHLKALEHEKGLDYIRRALALKPDHAEAHYNLGVALGKLQRNEEALACYQKALVYQPGYMKAYVRAGEVLNLLQRYEEALQQSLHALAIQPDCGDACFIMGVAHSALGKPLEAIAAYRQAVRFSPWHAEAHNNLGYTLGGLQRFEEAIPAFKTAISLIPDFIDAHIGLARILANLKRHDEAISAYLNAYSARPDAECAYELARLLQELKRFGDAIDFYRHAVAAKPDYFKALEGLGLALFDLKRYDEAATAFKQILDLNSGDVPALINLGNTLYEHRKFEDAIARYRQVLSLDQDNVAAHNGLGSVLVELNRVDEAIACFERALSLDPGYDSAVYNLGVALGKLLRFDEALGKYEQAITLNPNFAEAAWNRGLVHLVRGDFRKGWPDYEFRRQLRGARPLPQTPYPRWTGAEGISGRKLLIQVEQGYGDTLQAVRYIPMLEARGAECWMQCPAPLSDLIHRSFPNVRIIEIHDVPEGLDFHIPIMSLPCAMGTYTEADIPRLVPYLRAEPGKTRQWKERLAEPGTLRMGLVWRGNPNHGNDHNRSARLSDYLPLIADHPECQFVALQKDLTAEERAVLGEHAHVRLVDEELVDFDESAAVIANLDVLVTIDSAPAHLAGALGVPLWLLLPFHGEWRWLLDREDTPWYPNARLFRQASFGDWGGLVQQINTQLELMKGNLDA